MRAASPRKVHFNLKHLPWASALQEPGFRRLWVSGVASYPVRQLAFTVYSWLVVKESSSPFIVSLVPFAWTMPALVGGFLGGEFADTFDRRTLLVVLQVLLAATYGALAVVLAAGASPVWPVIVAAAATGFVWSIDAPARRSFMFDLAGRSKLSIVLSADSALSMGMLIVGPLLAAALLPVVAAAWVLAGMAAMSLVSAAGLLRTPGRVKAESAAVKAHHIGALIEGLRLARRDPLVAGTLAVALIGYMFAWAFWPLIPVYSSEVLHGGAPLLGVIYGVEGVGAFLAIAAMSFLGPRLRLHALVLVLMCGLSSAAGLGLALSSSAPLTLGLIAIAGGMSAVFVLMHDTVLLLESPEGARGRAVGLIVAISTAYPLGGLIVGALAEWTSPAAAVVTMSAAGVALTLLAVLLFPALRRKTP